MWSVDDQQVDEILAVAKNVTIAQAAYQAALGERPDRVVRLRIRVRVIEERLLSVP